MEMHPATLFHSRKKHDGTQRMAGGPSLGHFRPIFCGRNLLRGNAR
jgi:hypothetical protein